MNWLRRTFWPEQLREVILVLLIMVIVLFFGLQIDGYLSARTANRIASSVAVIAVVAVGQTLVVLTRNIDLSVGSIVGLSAYFVGIQLAANPALGPLAAGGLALGVGAALGLVNGLLIAYGRVPAIITTLGTLALYRTLLIEYADARTVTTASLPTWLTDLPRTTWLTLGEFELRPMVVIALLVVLLFHFALRYVPFGRQLYAIGSNPDAAQFAGLPAARIILTAYVICGALAGLGGFLFLARFGTVTVVAGQGLELQAVAAVVVGGVNTFGGSGTPIGALLGAVLIDTLGQSLLRWLSISEFWRDAILGLFILAAVASDAIILKRLRAIWARSAGVEPK
jgi:rhamnose transport system permease protein